MNRTRMSAVAALAIAGALGLGGCATATELQVLTIEYTVDGQTKTAEIEVPGVRCNTTAGRDFLSTTAPRPERGPGRLTVALDDGKGVAAGVQVSDDLWFVSTGEFSGTADEVVFDGLAGYVGPPNGDMAPTESIGDGTLSGSLHCTTTVGR